METILFYAFAAVAALAGGLAVSRKNAVASACWLVVMFFGLAGIYVLLEAYFVAAVQILVYAGAIMVLFLFVIMLLDLRSSQLASHSGPKLRVMGVLLAVAFTVAVIHALHRSSLDPKIADRVTAVLRLPAPPTPDPKDPMDVPVPLPAPAPVDVELHEIVPVAAPSDLGQAPGEGWGDRAYQGDVSLAPSGASKSSTLLGVTISPDGALKVTMFDAAARKTAELALAGSNSVAPPSPNVGTQMLTYQVPSVPGATIDVIVNRGGLESRLGGGPDGSPRAIGKAIFEDWLLPFEIVSLLLTGAIFGAVVLTKRRLP